MVTLICLKMNFAELRHTNMSFLHSYTPPSSDFILVLLSSVWQD